MSSGYSVLPTARAQCLSERRVLLSATCSDEQWSPCFTPPGLSERRVLWGTACSDGQRVQCVTPPGLSERRVLLSAACSDEQRPQCVAPLTLFEQRVLLSATCGDEKYTHCATPLHRRRRLWCSPIMRTSTASLRVHICETWEAPGVTAEHLYRGM